MRADAGRWARAADVSVAHSLKRVNILCAAVAMETGIGCAETAQGFQNRSLKNKIKGG